MKTTAFSSCCRGTRRTAFEQLTELMPRDPMGMGKGTWHKY